VRVAGPRATLGHVRETRGQTHDDPARAPGRARARRAAACGATALALALALALGGCSEDDVRFQYSWDDRRVVCSQSIDNITQVKPWEDITEELSRAARRASVALFHTHVPGETISMEWLLDVLALADRQGLDFVTYADFAAGAPPRPGLALAFDDDAVGAWFALRGILAERGARVTFFVTKYYSLTDEARGQLAALAQGGHSIQAHSVDHLDASAYVAEHGIDAYLADEAVPSLEILRAAGYAPTAYAYPAGVTTAGLDEAMLEIVEYVRVGPRLCPH